MKLILSRKGFDTHNGGGPSPILPDGRMLSLPIPERRTATTGRPTKIWCSTASATAS